MSTPRTYATDLTDDQWALIERALAVRRGPGRPREVDLRQMVNGLRYLNRTGCQWRLLPKEFGYWGTVRYSFDQWTQDGTLERLNTTLREQLRRRAGPGGTRSRAQPCWTAKPRRARPSAGSGASTAEKKVVGRKRHVLVDTLGLLLGVLGVLVEAADVSDVDGGVQLLATARPRQRFGRIRKVWMDGAYSGWFEDWCAAHLGWTVEIPAHAQKPPGFQVLPKRWIVERSLAWLSRPRRLAREYKELPACSAAHVYLASISLLLNRLAPAHA